MGVPEEWPSRRGDPAIQNPAYRPTGIDVDWTMAPGRKSGQGSPGLLGYVFLNLMRDEGRQCMGAFARMAL